MAARHHIKVLGIKRLRKHIEAQKRRTIVRRP